jgi:hypothetical protein
MIPSEVVADVKREVGLEEGAQGASELEEPGREVAVNLVDDVPYMGPR